MESIFKTNNNIDLPFDHYIIIAKFFPSQTNSSFNVPCEWNIRKFRRFIKLSFEALIHCYRFDLLFKGQRLINDSLTLRHLFALNQINNVHVVIINNKENKLKTKTRIEMLQSKDFALVETERVNDYLRLTNQTESIVDYSLFPFAHPCIAQQIETMNKNNLIEQLKGFDINSIEHYPIRGYFQFWLLLKMVWIIFIFHDLIENGNQPLMLIGFVGYYWMEVITLIKEYYQKKIDECQLTNEELNEGNDANDQIDKNKDKDVNDNNEMNKNDIQRDRGKNDNEDRGKNDNDNDNTKMKSKGNNQPKKVENDLIDEQWEKRHQSDPSWNSIRKDTSNDKKEEMKEQQASINDTKPELSNSNNNNRDGGTNNNANVNSNANNQNQIENNELSLIIEIVITFFLSLFPFWSDKFELKNPMPSNEDNVNLEPQQEDNNINQNQNEDIKENDNEKDLNTPRNKQNAHKANDNPNLIEGEYVLNDKPKPKPKNESDDKENKKNK